MCVYQQCVVQKQWNCELTVHNWWNIWLWNIQVALWQLNTAINELESLHPDSFIVVAGDINQVLPKFQQHVYFPTREANILDLM